MTSQENSQPQATVPPAEPTPSPTRPHSHAAACHHADQEPMGGTLELSVRPSGSHHPSVPQAGSSSSLLSPSGDLALWLPMFRLQPAVHTTPSLPCWNSVAPSPGSMAPTTLRPGTGLSHIFQPLPPCPVGTTPYLEQDSLLLWLWTLRLRDKGKERVDRDSSLQKGDREGSVQNARRW